MVAGQDNGYLWLENNWDDIGLIEECGVLLQLRKRIPEIIYCD